MLDVFDSPAVKVAATGLRCLQYVVPIALTVHLVASQGWPEVWQLAMIFVSTVANIGICMSVCLHRYFAHSAFGTTRLMQLGLGVLACLAYQRGPLWWASKHRRHHAFCDLPEDPHSWSQTSLVYAWVGWLVSDKEAKTDAQFVTKLHKYPELVVVDQYWLLLPILANYLTYCIAGYHTMVCLMTLPMLLCRLITTLFNVEYHPKKAKADCKAEDNARFLSELVGESYHADHHVHPAKSRRPGLDLPFHLFIRPMAALGLVWQIKGSKEARW